jgi:excisionase family DNA binding protein
VVSNVKVGGQMKEHLSVSEAARKLGISLDGVYRLLYSGKLAGAKTDGKWQIPTATVEERLRKRGHR